MERGQVKGWLITCAAIVAGSLKNKEQVKEAFVV